MTDRELVHAIEAALPGLQPFHLHLYALARLRVQRGEPLKATQRQELSRIIRLAQRFQDSRPGGFYGR